jgi:hypothetical protein
MPVLMEEMLRASLDGVDVEVLPHGAGIENLRPVDEHDAPPIAIVVAEGPAANQFERDLLVPHPQTLILRVEDNGHVLACRAVEVKRRVRASTLTAELVIDAIRTAPSWRKRFA